MTTAATSPVTSAANHASGSASAAASASTDEADREVLLLLRRSQAGDRDDQSRFYRVVEQGLRRIALAQLRTWRPGDSVRATVLVDETFMKLLANPDVDWQDLRHFFRVAAKAMRNMLIDRERTRRAAKRGGNGPATACDVTQVPTRGSAAGLLELDDALHRLARLAPRQAEVIQLRHFGGHTLEEIAEILEVSVSTVKTDHASAKQTLQHLLQGR